MGVADLLAAARTAHQRYRQAAGRIDKHGKVTRHVQLAVTGDAVREALALRTEADRLDPERSDSAWLEDAAAMQGQVNTEIVTFYVRYLAPEAKLDVSEKPRQMTNAHGLETGSASGFSGFDVTNGR